MRCWLTARRRHGSPRGCRERVAVVVPGAQDKLIERLRSQGHLPKVLDG